MDDIDTRQSRATDLRILHDSLQVCRNLLDAASQLPDAEQVAHMADTAESILASVKRLRRAMNLDDVLNAEVDRAMDELQGQLSGLRG